MVRDNFIPAKTGAELRAVFAPKVTGLLNLERACAALAPDFLTFFADALPHTHAHGPWLWMERLQGKETQRWQADAVTAHWLYAFKQRWPQVPPVDPKCLRLQVAQRLIGLCRRRRSAGQHAQQCHGQGAGHQKAGTTVARCGTTAIAGGQFRGHNQSIELAVPYTPVDAIHEHFPRRRTT